MRRAFFVTQETIMNLQRVQYLTLITLIICTSLFWHTPGQLRAATGSNSAHVVVQLGNGELLVRRVTFDGTISGLEALRRTGLTLVEKNNGVCRIEDTGCSAEEECFCGCEPPNYEPCLFWSYQRWDGTSWKSSAQGAGLTTVSDGDIEGWTWGYDLPPITDALLGAHSGMQWLKQFQNANGSYGSSNGNAGATIDTLLAYRALGGNPHDWRSTNGASLTDALTSLAPSYATSSAAAVGKLMLGIAAADGDPRNFAKLDLVISATTHLDSSSGAYGTSNWDQAFMILGLRASRETPPAQAITLLKTRAKADGGWGFMPADQSDVDSTGLVLQALASAGVPHTDAVITKALDYLDSQQSNDGGFPYRAEAGNTSNANSTALAIQGILASGSSVNDARWQPSATTPISYLLDLQTPAGAFTYGGAANAFATQQSIPALAGQPFPFASTGVAKRLGLRYIATQQQADGSFAGFGVGSTIDAILAIDAAGGVPQNFVSSAGKRPLDYLATKAANYATSAAASGKLLAGIVAADAEPRNFAKLNLVISTTVHYNPSTGAYGTSVYDQAWAIIGLSAAGHTVPDAAVARLLAMRASNGGWGFTAGDTPDVDSTSIALQALAATTKPDTACTASADTIKGITFLRANTHPDGGFLGYGGSASAASTGQGLQALAAFQHPARGPSWSSVTTATLANDLRIITPLDGLLAMQTPQGGFPGFSGPNDPDSTYQVLAGMAGHAYPASRQSLMFLPVTQR